jgi:hypothetical protein
MHLRVRTAENSRSPAKPRRSANRCGEVASSPRAGDRDGFSHAAGRLRSEFIDTRCDQHESAATGDALSLDHLNHNSPKAVRARTARHPVHRSGNRDSFRLRCASSLTPPRPPGMRIRIRTGAVGTTLGEFVMKKSLSVWIATITLGVVTAIGAVTMSGKTASSCCCGASCSCGDNCSCSCAGACECTNGCDCCSCCAH